MKKMLLTLCAMVCLFFAGAAGAAEEDGASIYQANCQTCHGADGKRAPVSWTEPLAGKNSADIMTMLRGYKDGSFGGQRKHVMIGVVDRLSEEQLQSVSEHLSKQ